MNETNAFWAGPEGDSYTQRCRVDWRARIPFWTDILDRTGARSVYEVGCNAGWNLSAMQVASRSVMVYGHEINETARQQAVWAGLEVWGTKGIGGDAMVDLVVTVGVLIHVAPGDLREFMLDICRTSADYVLAVEYEAPEETEVEYRGKTGLLWKRDFGKLYADLGLTPVDKFDAGPAFDRCTAWILRK